MSQLRTQLENFSINEWLLLLGFIIAINILGATPAFFVGSDTDWIEKPWFYPPEILFPIVWTALFTLMGVALFLIVRSDERGSAFSLALLAFAIQFGLNLSWTPFFFGLQRPDLGFLIILLLWLAIVGTIILFLRISRIAGLLLVPYLLWVSFATVLNYAIAVS